MFEILEYLSFLFYFLGKRLQEIVCFTVTVILMCFNFVELFLHFRSENSVMIFGAACKYIKLLTNPLYSDGFFHTCQNNYNGIVHYYILRGHSSNFLMYSSA